jgi:hypothetical protein
MKIYFHNDHKLLHDAILMKVNILDAQHFTAETWCHFFRITIVYHFHNCGFHLNQTNDSEDATDDCGKLKVGVIILRTCILW